MQNNLKKFTAYKLFAEGMTGFYAAKGYMYSKHNEITPEKDTDEANKFYVCPEIDTLIQYYHFNITGIKMHKVTAYNQYMSYVCGCPIIDIEEEVPIDEIINFYKSTENPILKEALLKFIIIRNELNDNELEKLAQERFGKEFDYYLFKNKHLEAYAKTKKNKEQIFSETIVNLQQNSDNEIYKGIDSDISKINNKNELLLLSNLLKLSIEEEQYGRSSIATSMFVVDEKIYSHDKNKYSGKLYDYLHDPRFKIKVLAHEYLKKHNLFNPQIIDYINNSEEFKIMNLEKVNYGK